MKQQQVESVVPVVATPTEITVQEPKSEIGHLLQLALTSGVPVETIERLVALKERAEARNAAEAMTNALAAFQAECPHIRRTSQASITTGSGGSYGYKYAELDQIASVIRPLLVKHGLAYSWDMDAANDRITCTCILRHVAGHSLTAKFATPTSTKSAMSDQQKVAAALTYARRQSLVQVLGLTMTDKDTDGAVQNTAKITEQQGFDIEDLIRDSGADRAKFLAYMGVASVGDILAADYQKARTSLLDKMRKKGGAS